MEIEGIKAEHAQITPNCRKLKGDFKAIEDALDIIREELYKVMEFDANAKADFNIVLSVKRPRPQSE